MERIRERIEARRTKMASITAKIIPNAQTLVSKTPSAMSIASTSNAVASPVNPPLELCAIEDISEEMTVSSPSQQHPFLKRSDTSSSLVARNDIDCPSIISIGSEAHERIETTMPAAVTKRVSASNISSSTAGSPLGPSPVVPGKALLPSPTTVQKSLKPSHATESLDALLSVVSHVEVEKRRRVDELNALLNVESVAERALAKRFCSSGNTFQEFCDQLTADRCKTLRASCDKLHFKKIILPYTQEALGDCPYIGNCFRMDSCPYVHYDFKPKSVKAAEPKTVPSQVHTIQTAIDHVSLRNISAQWIQCDVRYLDLSVLGKFSVIMADPPWDIHMKLPYGTMSDDEMRSLNIPSLQDEGFLFLWVTGRAMELARELFETWNYRRCDEIVWLKTNQIQRLIRTGRTGHWLNHAKEHCLVGVKGDPKKFNRYLDCDVLVAEVRDTSQKPDEIYGLIERLSPGTRKIEIFGRQHNVQRNWVTLGNQLKGIHIEDPEMAKTFSARYPEGSEARKIAQYGPAAK